MCIVSSHLLTAKLATKKIQTRNAIAHALLPGQWPQEELIDDTTGESGALAAPSLFTTVARYAPTLNTLCAIFGRAIRIFNRYARRQQIQAEPVIRADGARKKILLDAGLEGSTARKPRKPSRQPEHRSSPNTLRVPSNPNGTPDHTPISQAQASPSVSPSPRRNIIATTSLRDYNSAKKNLRRAQLRNRLRAEEYDRRPVSAHGADEDDLFRDPEFRAAYKQVLEDAARGYKAPTLTRPGPWEEWFLDEREEDEEIGETSAYDNDISMVDAPTPPVKHVSWTQHARHKRFRRNSRLDEMLDSSMVSIMDEPDDPNGELSYSEEFTEELANQSRIQLPEDINFPGPVNQYLPGSPTPSRTPTPSPEPEPLAPLLPKLNHDQLKHIVRAAEITNSGRKKMQIVEGKLETKDLGSVLPSDFNGPSHGWLNDEIINGYIQLLVDQYKAKVGYVHKRGGPAPPIHAFPSQFWTSASDDIKKVGKWAFRKQMGGRHLLDVELLLIPFCVGSHWRLIAIKPKAKTVEYLDSLYDLNNNITNLVFEYLKQELGSLFVQSEWSVVKDHSQKQLNSSDCGVFTCLNALALIKGEGPDRIDVDNGMLLGRRHIAASVISQEPTVDL